MKEINFNAYSSGEFKEFSKVYEIHSKSLIKEMVDSIVNNGLCMPLTEEFYEPNKVSITSLNYRETLSVDGVNSRARAVMLTLKEIIGDSDFSKVKIHCAEAISSFSLKLRSIFIKAHCSEYSTNKKTIEDLYPIPIENLLSLKFPDDSFDIQVSNDVLEHVPDLENCLGESFRILKKGGHLIFTIPFDINSEKNLVKAKIINGHIKYLAPKEFHGDPLSEKGSLVFLIPGWETLQMALSVGFSESYLKCISSVKYGIVDADSLCILVVVCKK
jgi:SAM-dependent methyltransferase